MFIFGNATDLPKGWFLALSVSKIGTALNSIHTELSRFLTLAKLARIAGMSRTVFAQRFKVLVDNTAINDLSRWRMLQA